MLNAQNNMIIHVIVFLVLIYIVYNSLLFPTFCEQYILQSECCWPCFSLNTPLDTQEGTVNSRYLDFDYLE